MARCYSDAMRMRQTLSRHTPHALPRLWLVSDARNDAALEDALARMPRGSGLIFRHYHLPPGPRRARFAALARAARARGHVVVLAGSAQAAAAWGADGAYGDAAKIGSGPAMLRLVTAHSLKELRAVRADALLLSPVFPTRSHPGAAVLGPVRFGLLARQARVPIIALGGMTSQKFGAIARLGAAGWAGIDGLAARVGPSRRQKRKAVPR